MSYVSALFLFRRVLEYAIREVPAKQKSLKLNGTLEILFCANDANLLEVNRHTVCEGNGRGTAMAQDNKSTSC
jgi:hypothetical protein